MTRDVLPAIRKDGAYVMGEEKVATGEMAEEELLAKAFGILQKKIERLTQEQGCTAAPGRPNRSCWGHRHHDGTSVASADPTAKRSSDIR